MHTLVFVLQNIRKLKNGSFRKTESSFALLQNKEPRVDAQGMNQS